jgi:hypothetical protein
LHNLKIGSRKRALEIIRGTLSPQRSVRKDDCLSAKREFKESAERSAAHFVFAAKRGGAGSKNIQRAKGSRFSKMRYRYSGKSRG